MAEEKMADRAARPIDQEDAREKRERGMDQTLEDTYPASDPLSTIPDPEEDAEAA
ncbi:MAG TPA: hypothetical protein VEC95_01195 [Terriglobales bacterium]|nr:hypothetical protein [Terriglobales bacterium]